MSIIDTVKSRPLLFGGVVVGGVVLLIALRSTSGGQVTSGTSDYGSDVGMGDQLQMMQLQTQRDIGIAQIQGAASADSNAAALEAAKLKYEADTNAANINANVSLATINATLQSLVNKDTLTAQTEQASIGAQRDIAAINANAQVEAQRTLANALVSQAQMQANVSQSYIAAQVATAPKQGLLSRIFG